MVVFFDGNVVLCPNPAGRPWSWGQQFGGHIGDPPGDRGDERIPAETAAALRASTTATG